MTVPCRFCGIATKSGICDQCRKEITELRRKDNKN